MGLFRRKKNTNKPLIKQTLDLIPRWIFDSCTKTHQTDKGVRKVTLSLQTKISFEMDLFSG